MRPAYVNDWEQARLFFEEYEIPYVEITEGKDKGKLLVKPTEHRDYEPMQEAEKRLRRSRLSAIIDHPNAFPDKNDDIIVTFSTYDVSELPKGRPWLEMSEHSIYGHGTTTFVVRTSSLNREKQQAAEKKALNEGIKKAEKKFCK